jgi:hypothetical protein
MAREQATFRAAKIVLLQDTDHAGVNWSVDFIDPIGRDHIETAVNMARIHFNVG